VHCFAYTSATPPRVIAGPGPIAMASEPGANRIAIAMLEWCSVPSIRQNGQNDFSVATWDGTSFVSIDDIDGTPAVDYTTRVGAMPVGVAWAAGTAIAVYEDASTLSWATWTTSGWTLRSVAAQSPSLPVVAGFQLLQLPTNDVMLLIEDVNQSLWARRFDGSAFSDANAGAAVAASLYVAGGRPFGALVEP